MKMELVHRVTGERVSITPQDLRDILGERSESMFITRQGNSIVRELLSPTLHWYVADIWDIIAQAKE